MAKTIKKKKKIVENPCPKCGGPRTKFFVPRAGKKMLSCSKCCELSEIKKVPKKKKK